MSATYKFFHTSKGMIISRKAGYLRELAYTENKTMIEDIRSCKGSVSDIVLGKLEPYKKVWSVSGLQQTASLYPPTKSCKGFKAVKLGQFLFMGVDIEMFL